MRFWGLGVWGLRVLGFRVRFKISGLGFRGAVRA